MDDYDVFESIRDEVESIGERTLGALADIVLGANWIFANNGIEDTIEQVTKKLYSSYFDSGAADEWGPSKYALWFIHSNVDNA